MAGEGPPCFAVVYGRNGDKDNHDGDRIPPWFPAETTTPRPEHDDAEQWRRQKPWNGVSWGVTDDHDQHKRSDNDHDAIGEHHDIKLETKTKTCATDAQGDASDEEDDGTGNQMAARR